MKQLSLFLLPALLLVLATGCSEPPSVEQAIVSKIREIEARIEAGERRRFLSNIAEDFRGQNGRMTREQLRAFVVLQLTRYKDLDARLFPIAVQEVSETEARATFKALLTGGSGLIPEDGQLYEFTTHWRLDDGEWLLVAADWKPVAMGELMN